MNILNNGEMNILFYQFDAVILAVAHNEFNSINIRRFLATNNGVVYDVKGVLNKEWIDGRL